jgi:YtxH-like protein
MRDSATDFGHEVRRRSEDAYDRVQTARADLQGTPHWVAPAASFVGGAIIGIGCGLLLAPVSGEEARSVIRDRVVEMKNRVGDAASSIARSGSLSSAVGEN